MFRSLRWRIQAWHTLILLLVVTGFGGMLYAEASKARFDEIDGELLAAARVLEGVLRTVMPPELGPRRAADGPMGKRPPGPREHAPGAFDDRPPGPPGPLGGPPPHRPLDPGPPGQRLMPVRPPRHGPNAFSLPHSFVDRYEEAGESPYFVIRSADGAVIRALPPAMGESVPADPSVGRIYESHARNRGMLREVSLLGPGQSTILVGRPIYHELAGLRRMALRLGLAGFCVFSAGMIGGWWLSARAVRPIVAMSETVSSISATNLERRLDLAGVDSELASLGGLINTMLERLGRSFAQQVRFTADASHELRTPVSVILTQVEVALSRPREGPAYRESLAACGRAATRMKSLVDDLLTLARADSGKLELRVEPVDVAQIAEECIALMMPLARERGIRIETELRPSTVNGDPQRLGQVVTNLLSNAIQYNRLGGQVVVSVREDDDGEILVVSDTGVGIPESDLPLVFDRFHRVDAARSRESGGSGLGLAICKSIVIAHGGAINVTSVVNQGSRFTVTIPRGQSTKGDEF